MADFYYKVLTPKNKIKEGRISSLFKASARKKLIADGSAILVLRKEKKLLSKNITLFRFPLKEKINFYRNFSIMVSAGLSIVEVLETLSLQVKNSRLKKAILDIAQNARNGKRLSDSMARYPKYFPVHIVETINMGDVAGKLTDTIDRIANDLEKDDELLKKVKSAMAYPLVVVSVMLVVVFGLSFYILPEIQKLYNDFGTELPQPTKGLLATSSFMADHKISLIVFLAAFIILFAMVLRTKKGRYAFHAFILKLPIFGGLIKEYNLIRFFRSLESLFASGISLIQGVEIAKKTTRNDVYKRALENINPILLRGISFSDSLLPYPNLFPVQIQKILRVGEHTGKLTETLKRTVAYFERSVDYKTRTMASLIEPVLMLILAVFVGSIAISVFLPLYNLINVL
jgi:type IV pilus assembly protein PilC